MSFISEEDIQQQWRYVVSEFDIIYPKKTIKLPTERIVGMNIYNDYENNLFPVFRCSVVLEPSKYLEIVENKEDVKFKIRIQKYYRLIGTDDKKSLLRDYINDVFTLILDDDAYDPDEGLKKSEERTTGDKFNDEDQLRYTNNKIDFYFFKSSLIKGMKKTSNAILENCDMSTAIAYLCNSGKIGKVLMSPIENATKYKQIILPPQSIAQNLVYLDNQFGLYKAGSLIYMGLYRGYILNHKGGCTAYQNKEYKETNIMIPDKGKAQTTESCMLNRKNITDKYNVVLRADDVSISNETVTNNVLSGNNATIVNTNTEMIDTSSIDSNNTDGSTVVLTTTSENKFISNTFAFQRALNKVVITCSAVDVDLHALEPNKKFNFLFEDTKLAKKYKGMYIISSMNAVFIKSGTEFTVTVGMTFKQCPKNVKVNNKKI